MDTQPTISVLIDMAQRLREGANTLERLGEKLGNRKDWDYVVEAMVEINNINLALRTDLLIARPLMEFQRELQKKTPAEVDP